MAMQPNTPCPLLQLYFTVERTFPQQEGRYRFGAGRVLRLLLAMHLGSCVRSVFVLRIPLPQPPLPEGEGEDGILGLRPNPRNRGTKDEKPKESRKSGFLAFPSPNLGEGLGRGLQGRWDGVRQKYHCFYRGENSGRTQGPPLHWAHGEPRLVAACGCCSPCIRGRGRATRLPR